MKRMWLILMQVSVFMMLLHAAGIAEKGIQPYYSETSRVVADLSISGGVAECYGSITPGSSKNDTSITIKLQRKEEGKWVAVGSWHGSATDGRTASASGAKNIISGYTYRLYVSGIIRDSNGTAVEWPSRISAEKTY